jgi:hypothetical protein
MTAKTRIEVSAHPDLSIRLRLKPFEFALGGQGSFAVTTGDIHVRFDEIPVSVAIPFLRRRFVAGSVGPFGVRIKPFEAQFRAFGLDLKGVLGRENATAEAEVHARGDCKAEIEISGRRAEQALRSAIKTKPEK